MFEKIVFKKCTPDDLETLCALSRKTYEQTFAPLNTPENMRAYLDKAFDLKKLRDELSDNHSTFYFLFQAHELCGYLKLNETPSQTDLNDAQSLELERIYVDEKFQGKGFGRVLMEQAIKISRERKKVYIWLGVWEKNEKAIDFYQKNGFYKIGTHPFMMGEEEQTDFIMRKDLSTKREKKCLKQREKC